MILAPPSARTITEGGGVIKVGLVGYGYWGPNLARNLAASRECLLAGICDLSPERLLAAAAEHPAVPVMTDWRRLIGDPRIDAVVLTTPPNTHFALSLAALRAGKHVFVEKPLAQTSEQVLALIEESERRRLVLMVDHTYVYSTSFRAIQELVRARRVGDPWYYESVRVNRGPFRRDVNVLWDLAVHDLAILDELLRSPPSTVMATGFSPRCGVPEQLAHLTLFYPSGFIAHAHVSWLAPAKVRTTLLRCGRQTVVWNDLLSNNKVKVYDCAADSGAEPRDLRPAGPAFSPSLEAVEPLQTAINHFAACVTRGLEPVSGGAAGLRVVRLLEAAGRSMEARGNRVPLDEKCAAA
jgi:predicted dehydrogenase